MKNGVVYFSSIDGRILAVDASTGELLWEIEDGNVSKFAVAEGMAFFITRGDALHAVDTYTGDFLWRYQQGYRMTPPVATREAVYVGVYFSTDTRIPETEMHAVDASNGELLWKHKTGYVAIPPAVADQIVYVGVFLSGEGSRTEDYLHALNAHTGELLWSHKPPTVSSVVVDDGVVYFMAVTGRSEQNMLPVTEQHAVDASTGELLWTYKSPGWQLTESMVIYGLVYFNVYVHSARGSYLYALDASTGELRWRYFIGNLAEVLPAVADDIAYVSSPNGRFYALDASSGELLWKYNTGTFYFPSPLVAGNIVYFGASAHTDGLYRGGHHLYALDASTGDLRWKYTTLEPEKLTPEMLKLEAGCMNVLDGHCRSGSGYALILDDDVIYFAGGDGYLHAVDTTDLQ